MDGLRRPMDLSLSTNCDSCGSLVSVPIPRWILAAVEQAQDEPQGASVQYATAKDSAEWRDRVIPGLLFTAIQAIVAFILFLDARFALHQRLAAILAAFFEGLVQIEKEVGLMRNAGEVLSVSWEAVVKGVIAFAKAEGPSQAPTRTNSFEGVHYFHKHLPAPLYDQGYPPYDQQLSARGRLASAPLDHIEHYASTSSGYHLQVPVVDSSDMSRGSSSGGASSASHGSGTTSTAGPSRPRSLRRAPFSSPTLQSAYLAMASSSTTPTLDRPGSPDAPLPPYSHLQAEGGFPFASGQGSPAHPAYLHQRPRAPRQRSVSGPEDSRASGAERRPDTLSRGGSWVLGLAERMKVL
ncbi:hypothetical protein JCM10207_002722 [Rhodosporidiobolus poonsookiae]